ncbi:MAG: hypothetical protein QXJ72_00290 [Thermoproteota archaeon]
MQENGTSKGSLFKKTVLLMSFFLILLFITYELLESPNKDFFSMKIIGLKEDEHGLHVILSISNNSNEKSEGVLLVMLGYEDSFVAENDKSYIFKRFKVYSQQVLQISPKREENLEVILPRDSDMKRILIMYFLKSDFKGLEENSDQIVLKKEDVIWVQTWVN